MTIVRFFAEHDLFEKPSTLEICWNDDEEFANLTIRPSLSLYDWSKLTPGEEGKLLTYEDYFEFARSNDLSTLSEGVKNACQLHMCEMVSRGFFRVWTLDPFMKLINYRLPIICCEQVLSKLTNEDLYRICMAAEGESS
uniref:Uncharacterized protein n=1 Tax=Trichogramma kaykai TaxID=54128 RepID=A0ABD2X6J2_9HYME